MPERVSPGFLKSHILGPRGRGGLAPAQLPLLPLCRAGAQRREKEALEEPPPGDKNVRNGLSAGVGRVASRDSSQKELLDRPGACSLAFSTAHLEASLMAAF